MDDQIYFNGIRDYLVWYLNIPSYTALDIVGCLDDYTEPKEIFNVGLEDYLIEEVITKLKNKVNSHPIKVCSFLLGLSFPHKTVDLIIKHYGPSDNLIDYVKRNPYDLIVVEGLNFSRVDKIALEKLGFDESHPLRLEALVHHHLDSYCNKNGHLFVTLESFLNSKFEVFIPVTKIKEYLKKLIIDKKIILEGKKLYTLRNYQAETQSAAIIAQKITETSDYSFFKTIDPDEFIDGYERIQSMNVADGSWKKMAWGEKGFKLASQQKEVIYKFLKEKLMVITGLPGTGKCFAKDTPILMFGGYTKKVQDIVAGDILMGPDSKPRVVTELSHGYDDLYEVIPTKGNSYTVNSNHILSLRKSKKTKAYGNLKQGEILNIPLGEYIGKTDSFKGFFKGYHADAIYFPKIEVSIDPYILGYWLGDGHSSGCQITTQDEEITNYFENYVKSINTTSPIKHFFKRVKGSNSGKASTYSVTTQRKAEYLREVPVARIERNLMLSSLKQYNLIDNKHIPFDFKINSFNTRLALLAGIIDSDGEVSVNSRNTSCSITLKNKEIIEDIISIAQSLGFAAFYKETYKACTNCDDTSKRLYHKALISGDLYKIPTQVSHKKFNKRKQIKNVLNQGIILKQQGKGEYFGFSVDGDHLFLLGDYTVVHNSTVTKSLVDISKSRGLKVGLMAPTGIAAKKLESICDHPANTIHRELGFDGTSWGKSGKNPIDYDVIIVDEFSMVDQALLFQLLKALPTKEHILIFVGDDAQLQSVAPGNVLRELVNCGKIPHVKLTEIFRQKDTSDIVLNAHLINRGKTDLVSTKKDFVFVEIEDEGKILDNIMKIVDKFEDKDYTYQILSPTYKGTLGVINLNNTMQEALNLNPSHVFFKTNNYIFKIEDKVMVIKNDYSNNVYNGEQGIITSINKSSKKITIYINGGDVEYSFKDAYSMLTLDYARTVHKSQGQEYDYVIMPYVNNFSIQLQRNLLYTAITRAKKKVFMLGHRSALVKSIKNNTVSRRNTIFSSRISTFISNYKEGDLNEVITTLQN